MDNERFKFELVDRAAAVAIMAACYADRINEVRSGSLTIHWDGDSLRPELHEHGARFVVRDAMPQPVFEPSATKPTSEG